MGLPIKIFIPAPLQYMYQSQIVNRLIQQNIRRLQWGLCGADCVAGRLTGELGWQQIVLRALQKHGTVTLETRVSFTMNHYVCSSVECSCSLGLGQIFFFQFSSFLLSCSLLGQHQHSVYIQQQQHIGISIILGLVTHSKPAKAHLAPHARAAASHGTKGVMQKQDRIGFWVRQRAPLLIQYSVSLLCIIVVTCMQRRLYSFVVVQMQHHKCHTVIHFLLTLDDFFFCVLSSVHSCCVDDCMQLQHHWVYSSVYYSRRSGVLAGGELERIERGFVVDTFWKNETFF